MLENMADVITELDRLKVEKKRLFPPFDICEEDEGPWVIVWEYRPGVLMKYGETYDGIGALIIDDPPAEMLIELIRKYAGKGED